SMLSVVLSILVSSVAALYFPNAAVLTQRDIGKQLSLNLSGALLAYVAYDNQTTGDQDYMQRVRIISNGVSTTLFTLSLQNDTSGFLYPTNFTTPITVNCEINK
ncbi:hypothetical protein PMAYCL1PPCAC_00721, partial [Pristionchus mayeri]